jgi:phasin
MATTTTTKTAKPAKPASFAMPSLPAPFDAFNFGAPSMEVPVVFREFAENSISQARDAYSKMKTAAEDATDAVQDTYETARSGAFTIGVKALDAAQANTEASFSLAKDLFGAKTVSEVIELQTAFARKQFDAFTAQAKEFQDLTQKFVTDTTKPVTAKVEKTFKEFKVA